MSATSTLINMRLLYNNSLTLQVTHVGAGAFYPPTTKALFPQLSPFPSCHKAAHLKPSRRSGERCKLPQWSAAKLADIDFGVF